jgi:hypothetical protein
VTGVQKAIKNGLLSGRTFTPQSTNAPYHADNQKNYFESETRLFYGKQSKWASNNVYARMQGLDYADFYAWSARTLRVSKLLNPTTGQYASDDWLKIMVDGGSVDFVPKGAKVVFNGNTYLVVSTENTQSIIGTCIIRRCNAIWNHLDYYGNVLSEPFCFGNGANDLATANMVKENMILVNAYQHSVMQLNTETSAIRHNSRMILGNQAYMVRGLQNFAQEFTTDATSVHMQYFDLDATEPVETDDMTRKVAEGNAFSWAIVVNGSGEMTAGNTQPLTAISQRNGETVTSNETNPITYGWSSNDPTIATVDASGIVTAVSEGATTITCALTQNPINTATFALNVASSPVQNAIAWKIAPPSAIPQYGSATFEAGYYENGQLTTQHVTYTYSGANAGSYTATQNGNSVTVECWYDDAKPLTVTASCNGLTTTAQIALQGW